MKPLCTSALSWKASQNAQEFCFSVTSEIQEQEAEMVRMCRFPFFGADETRYSLLTSLILTDELQGHDRRFYGFFFTSLFSYTQFLH